MSAQSAYDSVLETALVLLPELVLVMAAIAISTASVFIRRPRLTWWVASGGSLLMSLCVLLGLRGAQTDLYSAVALNDDLAFGARLVLILTGLVLEASKYVFLLIWPLVGARLDREYGVFHNSVTILIWAFVSAMIVLAAAHWAAQMENENEQRLENNRTS